MEWPFWPVKDEIHQDVKPKIEPPPNEVNEEKENRQVKLTLKDSEYTENIKLEQKGNCLWLFNFLALSYQTGNFSVHSHFHLLKHLIEFQFSQTSGKRTQLKLKIHKIF